MTNKTGSELRAEIEKGKSKIRLNERYFHYKCPEKHYTVTNLVIIEETGSVGVSYRAEYRELQGMVFIRPIESFLAEVDTKNGRVQRFTLVENNNITH